MKRNDLIKNSFVLCETANKVLEENNIIQVFSKLGHVDIIGSLKLKLMFRLDIDLLVISDIIDKNIAVGVTKYLLDCRVFKKVNFIDYLTYPEFDMPLGFYWELLIPYEKKEWKIDIWYLKPTEKFSNLVFNSIVTFESKLSKYPEKRELILRIKKEYFDGIKYKNNINSIDIYTAVLENNISSVDEFSKLFNEK